MKQFMFSAFAKRLKTSQFKYVFILFIALIVATLYIACVLPHDTHPYNPQATTDTSTILTITLTNREIQLSRQDIESLPMEKTSNILHYSFVTGYFSGVWLNDLLKQHHLNKIKCLRFSASDDYETFITRKQRQDKKLLLVTRINDHPIKSKFLGPLMIIIPSEVGSSKKLASTNSLRIWGLEGVSTQ